MSFLDKVKAGVKSGAEQAASRAQVEFDRLQTKRELQQAYADLGEKASELADRGELAHDELTAPVQRVRDLKAQLDAVGTEPAPEAAPQPEAAPEPQSEETPPA
jgi:hypothetical protein